MAFSMTGNSGTGSSGTRNSRGGGLSSEINVTPLIDVLLVMLIIFMVIVPVMPRGLNSSLLAKTAAAPRDEAVDEPILVEVEQGNGVGQGIAQGQTDARYRVNGVSVKRAEIGSRLQALLSRRSVRQVLLRADAKLDFGVVAGVIDAGQAAGAESIGLLTPGTLPR